VSLTLCPWSHRSPIYRSPCPICQRETLHKAFTCLTCGHQITVVIVRKRAFGARLVLNRRRP